MAKRAFDMLAGIVALIVFAPLMVVLAIAVIVSMGRPILFRQTRAGLGGRDFTLAKFRSMHDAVDAEGQPLPDEARVTRVGTILRRFRVDELPEFWQILTGDMSLVGPRPLPRLLLERQGILAARCIVRPGLTGLAQVSGNTLLTTDEKFAIDLYYVEHRSLLGDVGIVLKTLHTVAFGEKRDEDLIKKAATHADSIDRRGR